MPLFKVWNEDKLNKKFVVAENFAELVSKLSPPQRIPLGIPIKISIIEKIESARGKHKSLPTTQRGLCGRERFPKVSDSQEGLKRQKQLGKEKRKRKKMRLCLYKRANFADVLKCLRYQEIREMINRLIFKYIEFIMFTVLLEHLRAF